MHLVGGMDGTGGLIILGTMASEAEVTTESVKWIVVHILDNQQAQSIAEIETFVACKQVIPVSWSPMWFAHTSTLRRMSRQIGTRIIGSHTVDPVGEYLIIYQSYGEVQQATVCT